MEKVLKEELAIKREIIAVLIISEIVKSETKVKVAIL